MGISRDKAHKRRATGGKHKRIRMKRKFEMGRQPANTKIGEKKKSLVFVYVEVILNFVPSAWIMGITVGLEKRLPVKHVF